MLRMDGRVLAASVVGLFLVGAALGYVVAGVGLGLPTVAGGGEPTATPTPVGFDDADTPDPGREATPVGTTTTLPRSPASTVTAVPTPASATPTVTATPAPTATRTPKLPRRFDEGEIKDELRRLLDDWRKEQGVGPFVEENGELVEDLNRMAESHSVAMADAGRTTHTIDNRTSAERYHEYDVYWNCWFRAENADYFVTPNRNSMEVLARTYAGRAYETPNGTDYNGNETAVARDIFRKWTDNAVYAPRLAYENGTRIGIGIEITRDNEVYATGNVCGPPRPSG